MADSDTTQQAISKCVDAIIERRPAETHEAQAEIANNWQRRAEALKKKAMAEFKAIIERRSAETREAQAETLKKAEFKVIIERSPAEAREREVLARAIIANKPAETREAKADTPFLTTTQWLGVAGLVVSLQAFLTP